MMNKALLLAATALLLGGAAHADCPEGQNEVTVSISTDRYGAETTWALTGPEGSPVYASGGPYATQNANGSYPQTPVTVCIPDGSLVIFKIYDEYGDGICCSYGQGTYSVTMDGTVIVPYASFQSTRQSIFLAGPPVEHDLAMQASGLLPLFGPGNMDIKGTVKNCGTAAASGFAIGYSVDGGPAVTGSFTNNVNANGQYNFTHPVQWNATPGIHTIKIWAGLADGTPDGYTINDTLTATVNVATQTVQRTSLLEEFTSSTCGPCYQLNVLDHFDQLLDNLNANQPGSNLAAVKYQMNWPAPGNDPSYNGDGETRRVFYGTLGVPTPILDNYELPWQTQTPSATQFNTAMAKPAFAGMDVSYARNGNTVDVTVNVTPHFAGSGYKLYIAITEDYYRYQGAYTPQKDYHFVVRKMLPNGNGINMGAFEPDQEQTFNRSYTLVEGGPAQGNYNLWGTVGGITVVAFVQKTSTKEIVQAAFSDKHVGIDETRDNGLLRIWPNPAQDRIYLSYGKPTATDASIEVFNALGERVSGAKRHFSAAAQVETLDLSGLEPGMYLVRVIADGTTSTQRINLAK